MKKLIVQEMMTVDGFFAGPNGEIDWHNVDAEFNEYAHEVLNSVDTFLFGRVTYDLMASYWPTDAGLKDDAIIAEKMNSLRKIVFSKTQDKLTWNNSTVLSDIRADEIRTLKQGPGKDMIIFGSGTIVAALTNLDLIDEFRFIVNPVILGKGKSLFNGVTERHGLKLIRAQEFKSGNVLMCYEMGK